MEKGKKTLCMILSLGTAISFWKLHQLFERDACCKQIGSSLPERWKHFSLKPKKKIFGLFYFIRLRCTVPLRMLSKIYEWMNCTLPIVVLVTQQDLCITFWHMKRSTQFVQYSQYSIQFLWITSYSVLCYFKCLWLGSSKALAWNRTTEILCRISNRKKDTKLITFFYLSFVKCKAFKINKQLKKYVLGRKKSICLAHANYSNIHMAC